MATRSTITLKDEMATVNFYRHWDGYPEENGRFLAWAIKDAKNIETIAAALLTNGEGGRHGAGRYEFTDIPEMHGDREWHYEIDMPHASRGRKTSIRVSEYQIGSNGSGHVVFDGPTDEYRTWVANRYRQLIARYRARKAAA